ncbi:DNA damage-inducible transcript 3 protein-like [Grus americana]|uniref:DNA damage-inducible transcript 3 protein-like n=1 Tax=Grus americana TaxID=9117 RepID=UPI0024088056|nr:DNA damage-inducible transcript 3 protein-like [Grus americana]XP_054662865.1 DNA damage-inducible transcript 3 protein-like [Grus americana]
MAAEGLPTGAPASTLPSWELEAWYQDLQEVLAAAEPSGPSLPWGADQAPLWGMEGAGCSPEGCELDAALAAELLELLGPESTASTEPAGPPGSASSRSSPAQLGTEEDEAGAAAGHGVKRKRRSGMAASRELAKRREWANEQRVLELTSHNEQLREEIRRLSAEVERTRAALIDRIVNLRRA